MKRADIQGHIVTQATHPCGTLVKAGYDGSRRVMSFDVPSLSRGKNRVYAIELDATTGQSDCPCEAMSTYLNAHKMPYRREIGGAFLEQVYPQIYPLITRPPRFLCPHLKKVRLWLKRNKAPDGQPLYNHIAAIVAAWEQHELTEKKSA